MPKYKPKPMTKAEFTALRSLIDYNITDEEQHWKASDSPSEGHIYNSITVLVDYANKCEGISDEQIPN